MTKFMSMSSTDKYIQGMLIRLHMLLYIRKTSPFCILNVFRFYNTVSCQISRLCYIFCADIYKSARERSSLRTANFAIWSPDDKATNMDAAFY